MPRNTLTNENPNGTGNDVVDTIVGKGGKVRHGGYFSENNPYFNQTLGATNNKDLDALYERSVEWEVDRANLEEQRAYDRWVLEEQRAYDSPLAELQRQRAAGYNPDIAGSTGSSSGSSSGSAQLAQREIDDQQAQSQFKNVYADTQQVTSIINSASQFIGSMAGGFTSIASGISQLRQLPFQIKLAGAKVNQADASANQLNAVANNIKALQPGQVTLQSIEQSSGVLNNLLSLSSVLTPDSDISPILKTMGVSDSDVPHYTSAFSEFMKNPEAVANYRESQIRANQASANASVYTTEYFTRIAEKSAELNELQLDFETVRLGIQSTIDNYLSNSDYAENIAESMVTGSQVAKDSSQLTLGMLTRDCQVYVDNLMNLKNQVVEAKARRDELISKSKQTKGVFKLPVKLNEREQIELDYLNDIIPMLETTGANELRSMYSIARSLSRNRYLSNHHYANLNGEDVALQNLSLYWGDVVSGAKSQHDIVQDWVGQVSNALGIAATAYVGYRVGQPKSFTTTKKFYDSKGNISSSTVITQK